MTKLSKRIITLLVACFMMLSAAFAQSAITVNAQRERSFSTTIEHENPVYSPDGAQSSISSLSDAEISSFEDSIDESVIKYLRSELVSRNSPISVTIPYSEEYEDAAMYMWDKAVETYTRNPKEGDYIKFQYSYMGCHIYGTTSEVTYDYEVTYHTDSQQEQKVDEAVDTLLDDLNIRYKNDYQKIYSVYEWIAKHVSYEYNYETVDTKSIYAAYGALIDRVAVCQGYAVLFYRLMLELGVDCRVIAGIGNGGNHAWNIVKLNDKYYNIDVTWASTSGDHTEYFLRGSKYFDDHYPNDEYVADEFEAEYPVDPEDYAVTQEDLNEDDVCQGAVLDRSEIIMRPGETCQLNAVVEPAVFSQKVTWSSANAKVASVDQSGLVTAIAKGKTRITAEAEAGGKTAVCEVTVKEINPDDGHAYAIYIRTQEDTGWGDLVFFRSEEVYELGWKDEPVTDLYGNEYKGYLCANEDTIESPVCDSYFGILAWQNVQHAILRVYVAENQIVRPINMREWFAHAKQLTEFRSEGFDTSGAKDMSSLFEDCEKLVTADVSHFDTSKVQSLGGMFFRCRELQSVDLSNFNTESCESFSQMFYYCGKLNSIDISSFTVKDESVGMTEMFRYSTAINEIKLGPGFVHWNNNAYLPEGTWSNGTVEKTETELYEEYPANAAAWAGTWRRIYTPVHVTSVSLNKTSLELQVGQSETLTATVQPSDADNRNISWESDNPDVASVDSSGKVTAIAEGTAVITVTSEDGGKTAWCNVKVIPKAIPVTGIEIEETEVTIEKGGYTTLHATVYPENATNQNVRWTSSNTYVANAWSGGTVTANRAGTATITATTEDGGYTATCKVIVTDASIKVTGITLDITSAKLAADGTLQLKASVTPENAGNQNIKWTVNNKIATVDSNGLVTMGRSYGTAKVTATTEDGGYTATCTIEMQFKDVTDSGAYYYKPVYWAAKKSITKGYPEEGTFKPQDNCTREAVVTFLWRLAGKPEPKSLESPFSDITDPSAYYYKAVLWAAEKGITGGYSDGTFRPSDTCLREHVVTFLYRYAGKPKVNTTNTFTDVDKNDYYYKAVLWAADKGITKGYADDNYKTFRPKLDCLREHVVTFLYRYAKLK